MPGFSNVTSDEGIVFADNVSFDGTERGGKVTTDGQLLIGSTIAPHIKVGNITSLDGTLTVTNSSGSIDLSSNVVAVTSQQFSWTVAQNIPIFTPTRTFILYFITFDDITVNNLTISPQFNVGWTAPNYNDFTAAEIPSGGTQGKAQSSNYWGLDNVIFPVGQQIFLRVATPATATAYVSKVIFMGVYV